MQPATPKPNTPAAGFPDQVPEIEKEARSKELAAQCRETQQRFIQRYIGRTLKVLVEGKEGGGQEDEVVAEGTGNDGHERITLSEDSHAAKVILFAYAKFFQCLLGPDDRQLGEILEVNDSSADHE